MASNSFDSQGDCRQVDEVIAGYYLAQERGVAPSREALLARHPELAADLQEFFSDLEGLKAIVHAPLPSDGVPVEPTSLNSERDKTIDYPRRFKRPDLVEPMPERIGVFTVGSEAGEIQRLLELRVGAEFVPGYRLLERIGRGGFGEVWKAIGPGGVPMAAKFLQFEREEGTIEARAIEFMKFVNHPHLVTTFGIWHRDEYLIIGMELAERTLKDRLADAVRTRLPGIPPDELFEQMRETAKAIDFLNEPRHVIDGRPRQSIVHRDIKPQNLLLCGGGVKVADFGLARALDRTASGSRGGMTPAYAAPELFEHRVSAQSDQYGLAVTYCQLRTNRLPFEGSPVEVMAGHLTRPPNLAILPEAERPVVAKALAKDPGQRWPNCRAFVEELVGCCREHERLKSTPTTYMQVLTNSIGMKLVNVPAGKFLMGSPEAEAERRDDEGPVHFVTLTRPFYLGAYQVTQEQFELVMDGQNPSEYRGPGRGRHPVDSLSWYDAVEFCRRLSSRFEEREAQRTYVLPTEAEWEYACRAGSQLPFSLGASLSSREANFNGEHPYGTALAGPFLKGTTPVGMYPPNAYGLHDMHGNVWEWCADFYGSDYYGHSPDRDPLGPRIGISRVLRGGHWSFKGATCRSARRGKHAPGDPTPFDGFRVAMLCPEFELTAS